MILVIEILFEHAGIQRFDFEMMSLDPIYYTKLNKVDNLIDFPLICDHFPYAYQSDSSGIILAYGYALISGENTLKPSFWQFLQVGDHP